MSEAGSIVDSAAHLAVRDRLIVALDVSSCDQAMRLVESLDDRVTFYKLGMQLVFSGGLPVAEALMRAGKSVFLDMKLHDIGNTVGAAVGRIAAMGVNLTTVHAYPQTMEAASAAAAGTGLRVVAVTVLTSWQDADLRAAGYHQTARQLVLDRALAAQRAGLSGVVASAQEAAEIRARCGQTCVIVTPGIRFANDDSGDQKRVMTPGAAIKAGADYLVVGRPITAATEPRDAAAHMIDEIDGALG